MANPMLSVKDLKVHFSTEEGVVQALDNVSFFLEKGQILGIIGETGSGKSVTAYTINRLLPMPPGKIVAGEVWYDGEDILKRKESDLVDIRGKKISMIFQEPMTALNPVFTIKEQMTDVLMFHRKISREKATKKALEVLDLVRIPDPAMVMGKYPHELSGGMRQRIMIASALSCEAKLLIADEPTTALDVTTQDQILAILLQMRKELGISIILITHNFGVVAEICDTLAVMYAGTIVEFSSIYKVYETPRHPYTHGLLNAIPPMDRTVQKLNTIPGLVPNLLKPPTGCRFHPRCERRQPICEKQVPAHREVDEGHYVACHFPLEGGR
ncbi:MAG TPA: ABC transporter ATP-binding protein [Thermotogota bacterium]|nr:ABC transporter ATP-binding protein [Thermotogota bacterium]HRW93596.1 ABC transporter ATP-binding protein [Thermotogota bacterium]